MADSLEEKTSNLKDSAKETIHDFMITAQLMGYSTAVEIYTQNQEKEKSYRDIKSN